MQRWGNVRTLHNSGPVRSQSFPPHQRHNEMRLNEPKLLRTCCTGRAPAAIVHRIVSEGLTEKEILSSDWGRGAGRHTGIWGKNMLSGRNIEREIPEAGRLGRPVRLQWSGELWQKGGTPGGKGWAWILSGRRKQL